MLAALLTAIEDGARLPVSVTAWSAAVLPKLTESPQKNFWSPSFQGVLVPMSQVPPAVAPQVLASVS